MATEVLGWVLIMVVAMVGLVKVVSSLWWRPRALGKALERQGVRGPPPLFMIGNMKEIMNSQEHHTASAMDSLRHDIIPRMLPHFTKWRQTYGKRFVFWEGSEPRVVVTEPELIREVFSAKASLDFGKSRLHQRCTHHFLGKGVAMANADNWAHQRHLVAPAFHLDKIKGLAGAMIQCAEQMLDVWGDAVDGAGGGEAEIDVCHHLHMLTADIIARTEFGSSYEKGKKIFHLLTTLQTLTLRFAHFVWLPGSSFLPTSWNLEIWRVKRDMERSLREIIQERRDLVKRGEVGSYGKDLLGLMLAESEQEEEDDINGKKMKKKKSISTQQLMDECKTFFFAGHETSAGLLTWIMVLLASNPSWQERARNEVLQVYANQLLPDADSLHKLKIVGMIVNETLRLYPPVIVVTRYALQDMKLGTELVVPKDASVWIPLLAIHQDKEMWGEDAALFKPQRFEGGIASACKHPLAYLPFAFGPRNCVGQNFALMEVKLVLTLILLRFTFSLSPSYRHAPAIMLTLKPKFGAPIILRRHQLHKPQHQCQHDQDQARTCPQVALESKSNLGL